MPIGGPANQAVAATLPISQANVTGLTTALAAKGNTFVRGPFSFAFDTAGLNNGVTVYTPTVGDILLDAWIQVDTVFNGTTPGADMAQVTGAPSGETGAWTTINSSPGYPLGTVDAKWSPSNTGPLAATGTINSYSILGATSFNTARLCEAIFTNTDPLKLWVSQDGTRGGTAVGGTTGAAKLYIITATPVALP